mmetsp:Transcript_146500/g.365334  ORF Transcript_146500/g.365334 Transcript_146500/m.365334 type:complete len:206 (-) Transcript_146500:437-1054(-)
MTNPIKGARAATCATRTRRGGPGSRPSSWLPSLPAPPRCWGPWMKRCRPCPSTRSPSSSWRSPRAWTAREASRGGSTSPTAPPRWSRRRAAASAGTSPRTSCRRRLLPSCTRPSPRRWFHPSGPTAMAWTWAFLQRSAPMARVGSPEPRPLACRTSTASTCRGSPSFQRCTTATSGTAGPAAGACHPTAAARAATLAWMARTSPG